MRARIEEALRAVGRDAEGLDLGELGALDEFHLLGRTATLSLAQLAGICSSDRVLDVGAGLGGPARLLARNYDCHVTAVDITPEYCAIARWLNEATSLANRVDVVQADALALPFADRTFDVIWSQHAQMNVKEKRRLYAEARRVVKDGGRLAIWDVTAGPIQPIRFPVPWADGPEVSFLTSQDALKKTLRKAGFEVTAWNDLTERAMTSLRDSARGVGGPLGLHLFVPEMKAKRAALLMNLEEQRVGVVQAVLRAT